MTSRYICHETPPRPLEFIRWFLIEKLWLVIDLLLFHHREIKNIKPGVQNICLHLLLISLKRSMNCMTNV